MNRNNRAQLAHETVKIIQQGSYLSAENKTVDFRADLNACIRNTIVYAEDAATAVDPEVSRLPHAGGHSIAVTQETTLDAAFRLKDRKPDSHIVCLNFASAKNPGGGFLGGSQAQEESLARSSALYAAIADQESYYGYHRRQRTALYSDRMIFSPNVPVFRKDDGRLIDPYYLISFITAPAVNAGALKRNEPEKTDRILPAMAQRMEKVLKVAALHQADALVLGAWGCGVFQNDPREMARLWHEHLVASKSFDGRFHRIVFAVPGKATANYRAFADLFHAPSG